MIKVFLCDELPQTFSKAESWDVTGDSGLRVISGSGAEEVVHGEFARGAWMGVVRIESEPKA